MSENQSSSSSRYPVRYNPITGREMPSYHPPSIHSACSGSVDTITNTTTFQDHDHDDDDLYPSSSSSPPLSPAEPTGQDPVFDTEARAIMEASSKPTRFSETVEDTAPTTLSEALKVKQNDPQQLAMTKNDDDDFEDMVASEMEALRLEYGIGKETQSVDNEGEHVTATACRPRPSSAQPSSELQYRSIIPLMDENEERRHRRQKAQEYGAQLRIQMKQDAKTKNGNGICNDAMHAQEDDIIGHTRPDNDTASSSYGEQLRLQMKQEQKRRQLQKDLEQSCGSNGASGGFIFGSRDDASKQRKALAYKRQLDEQIDERRRRDSTHEACGTEQSAKGSKEASGYADLQTGSRPTTNSSRYQQALDYKRQLDEQIEEKHRLSAPPTATPTSDNRGDGALSSRIRIVSQARESDQSKARQKKKEYGRQLREQMGKVAMDRISPDDAPNNATSLPFFASSKDREVHEREKKREDALLHQKMLGDQIEEQKKAREKERAEARAESRQYAPVCDDTRPMSYVDNSSSPPSATQKSDNSHEVAKATSPLTLEGTAAPLYSSAACNAVVLDCETTFVAAPSSTTRRKPRETPGNSAHNCKDGEEKSVCKRRPRERRAERDASDPSVAPFSGACANTNAPIIAMNGDVLGQGMIQSALQKVEQNIPNGVEYRSSTRIEKKSTQPLHQSASENVNPRKEAKSLDICSREERYGCENEISNSFESDMDENNNDDEAEERLMQALSRIRNIMDTNLSDH